MTNESKPSPSLLRGLQAIGAENLARDAAERAKLTAQVLARLDAWTGDESGRLEVEQMPTEQLRALVANLPRGRKARRKTRSK